MNSPSTDYQSLDASKILETIDALRRRVVERFPDSSLGGIAEELVMVSRSAATTAHRLARPLVWLRVLMGFCVVSVISLFVATLFVFNAQVALYSSVADFLQGLDAAVNEMVFLGIAIFFLLTLETRYKRRWALKSLHVLRSMAHIIDLHQLTKDPEGIGDVAHGSGSVPTQPLTSFELARYLDYSSELLALIGNLAALHVQQFSDPVTLSAVNEIENLTQGLSRKIWQKIMILDRILAPK